MFEELVSENQPTKVTDANDEIHLLDLLVDLAQHKKLVIGTPIVVGVLAFAATFLMTPVFNSTAKIMPPQQQQSSGVAAMLGQLGGLAGAAGGLAGLKSPNDLYIGLLESRTIADNLIQQFKLKERYGSKTMDSARKSLALASQVSTGKKDGFISITVNDKDPQFAADMANAYVAELAKLTQTIALTEASQRRLFFEKQLADAHGQLSKSEIALRDTQERTGMIQPDGQVQAIIANVAQLKIAIAAKEVAVNAMRTFAASANPELLRAQEELRSMRAQLVKLEQKQPSGSGDFMVPTGTIPSVGVDYVRSVRDVKYNETIFELLAKQYELAKIDEAKDASIIQVLDKAIPAEHKAKPNRLLIISISAVLSLMVAMLWSLAFEAKRRALRRPETSAKWEKLKFYLIGR